MPHRTRAGTIPEGCVVEWQCNRRGNRIFEGSDVRRKATFPNLLLPGATKPEGSTSFPVCSTAWRIRLIEAFWGRQGEVLQLRSKSSRTSSQPYHPALSNAQQRSEYPGLPVLVLPRNPQYLPLRIMRTASSASSVGLRLLEGFCECEYSVTLRLRQMRLAWGPCLLASLNPLPDVPGDNRIDTLIQECVYRMGKSGCVMCKTLV